MVNNYLSPASQPWVRDIENKVNTALNTAQSAGKSLRAIFPTRTVNLNDGKITLTAPGAPQPVTIGSAIESNVVNFTLPDVMPDDYYLRVNTTVIGDNGTYRIDLGTVDGVMEITEDQFVAPGEGIEDDISSDATHVIRLPYINVAGEDVQANAEPEYEEIIDPETGEVTLQPKDNHTTQVDLPKNGTVTFVASAPGTRFVNTTVDVVPVNAGSVVIDVASEEPTIKIIDALGYERDLNDALDDLEVSFNDIRQTINDEAIAAQAKIQEVLASLDAEERARIEADEENRKIFEAFEIDQEQLTQLLASVNRKTSTTVSTKEPSASTPGTTPGDTWWRVDSSNQVFGQWTWDGSTWVSSTIREEMIASLGVHQLQVTGTAKIQTAVIDRLYNDIIITKLLKATEIITGSMLAEGTITGTKIRANTITGAKLLANSVGAREIAAKSISAEKLVIAPGNMFPDPNMQDVDNWSGSLNMTTVNGVNRYTAVISGSPATYNVPIQGMEPGKQYKVSLYVRRASTATSTIYSSIKATKSPTGATLPTATTDSPSVDVRHPDGTLNSYFWVDTFITVPNGEEFEYVLTVGATASTRLAGVKIVPMTDSSLIVDGSVIADKIAANAIEGRHITGDTITGDKLRANSVGAREITANSITAGHMVITPGNLFPDPYFLDLSGWNTTQAEVSIMGMTQYGLTGNALTLTSSGVQRGSYYQPPGMVDKAMLLEPGREYKLTAWVRFGVTATTQYIEPFIRYRDTSGKLKTIHMRLVRGTNDFGVSNSYGNGADTSVDFVFPADAAGTCTLGFFTFGAFADGQTQISNVRVTRRAGADLIVDGSIVAPKLASNSVTARTLNVVPDSGSGGLKMDAAGLDIISPDDEAGSAISMRVNTPNAIQFAKDGLVTFSATQDGDVATQNLSVGESLTYRGEEIGDLIANMPRGLVASAELSNAVISDGPWTLLSQCAFDMEPGRMYKATAFTSVESSVFVPWDIGLWFEGVSSGIHTIARGPMYQAGIGEGDGVSVSQIFAVGMDLCPTSGGSTRLGLYGRSRDTGKHVRFVGANYANAARRRTYLFVEDIGAEVPVDFQTHTDNKETTTTPAKTTYTKTWKASWIRNWRGTALYTWGGKENTYAFVGQQPSTGNQLRSMVGFPTAMTTELANSEITSIKLKIPNAHSYSSSGVTTKFGYTANTSAPASFAAGTSIGDWAFKRGETRTITLGATVGDALKRGTFRALTFQPPSMTNTHYGYYTYSGISITVTYKK